jgi:hypothetical protein
MSATDTRLSLAEATFAARKFRDLFPPETYERWEFAGSLRRGCRDVGDIEHVVVPRFVDLPGADLFATPAPTNLLMRLLDELVRQGAVSPHDYGGRQRWGPLYRGVDFLVLATSLHEVFCADADNWGPILAIRTGPPDFSRRLVTSLRKSGYRNKGGYVWRCRRCPDAIKAEHPGERCPKCQGTYLEPVEKVGVPDEQTYFRLCGVPFTKPEERR